MATTVNIINGICLEVLKTLPADYFDSCVTDPPYGIKFMGKKWDYEIPEVDVWQEVYRVLKPGAHILVACGTRTQHRMVVNIEDAGFEIRDVICWHYGSGFPKSMDISKAIDKENGSYIPGEVSGNSRFGYDAEKGSFSHAKEVRMPNPQSDEAKQWEGWGTALKPATEFWTLARKPIGESTVAKNVLKYGTGALNIDASRIALEGETPPNGSAKRVYSGNEYTDEKVYGENTDTSPLGRFPANVILDEFMGKEMDTQAPKAGAFAPVKKGHAGKSKGIYGDYQQKGDDGASFHDGVLAGASRFFYCAKADRAERNKGLGGFELMDPVYGKNMSSSDKGTMSNSVNPSQNFHPTVKPVDLMRYLVKLITPKGGHVLDPYCGSGTTGIGAKMELMSFTGIEREDEYCKIAEARISAWNPDLFIQPKLF